MRPWLKEQVEEELKRRKWYSSEREIQHGIQYILTDVTPVNWYKTGKVLVGGKKTELQQEAASVFSEPTQVEPAGQKVETPVALTRVFIVYGHDSAARDELELILRRIRIEPIILQNLPVAGDTIIEKLESLTATDFACVLLTPDDEGCKFGDRDDIKPRARQNVVLELGMVLAKLGRKNVAILVKGSNIERPSDIEGLIYIGFEKHVSEVTSRLAACLQEAGFNIQVKDLIS